MTWPSFVTLLCASCIGWGATPAHADEAPPSDLPAASTVAVPVPEVAPPPVSSDTAPSPAATQLPAAVWVATASGAGFAAGCLLALPVLALTVSRGGLALAVPSALGAVVLGTAVGGLAGAIWVGGRAEWPIAGLAAGGGLAGALLGGGLGIGGVVLVALAGHVGVDSQGYGLIASGMLYGGIGFVALGLTGAMLGGGLGEAWLVP